MRPERLIKQISQALGFSDDQQSLTALQHLRGEQWNNGFNRRACQLIKIDLHAASLIFEIISNKTIQQAYTVTGGTLIPEMGG